MLADHTDANGDAYEYFTQSARLMRDSSPITVMAILNQHSLGSGIRSEMPQCLQYGVTSTDKKFEEIG